MVTAVYSSRRPQPEKYLPPELRELSGLEYNIEMTKADRIRISSLFSFHCEYEAIFYESESRISNVMYGKKTSLKPAECLNIHTLRRIKLFDGGVKPAVT
jgi:hypothetical protein